MTDLPDAQDEYPPRQGGQSSQPEGSSPWRGERRTHPVTPLLTGWKVLAAVVAVILAQNLAQLANEFTLRRALMAAGVLLAVMVLAVAVSALTWWRTTYEITEDGVTLRSGLLTLSRRTAPQERIESVSVERPALARLLGLAKVRVEIAGGGDSYLDIAYVRSTDAERIRTRILGVASGPAAGSGDDTSQGRPEVAGAGAPAAGASAPTARDGISSLLYDGVTDGELIARIPTSRLLHSMLRDLGLVLGFVAGVVWVLVSVVLALRENGIGIGFLAVALPAVLTIPRMVLSRIEGGWGFVSRDTERGLRMRRGLFSTRTDNLPSGRIQDMTLHRPLLWRGPGWTGATVTVAGMEGEENGGTNALPVGTREELARTLAHLMPPLGTADDLATIEHLLRAPAPALGGIGPVHPLYVIGRRTRRAVLLPGALAVRSGILTRRLQIVPRERVQGLDLTQGPISRRTGSATLSVGVAGGSASVHDAPLAEVLALRDALCEDAAAGRRYTDREHWPRPVTVSAVPGGAS